MNKIREFTDLTVWKKAHEIVLLIYKITRRFPSWEKFGLSNQMQRCVVSITSNIAEGFARRSRKEKVQFYYNALGSLSELLNQILISRDLEYIDNSTFESLEKQLIEVRRLLNGLIKSSMNYEL